MKEKKSQKNSHHVRNIFLWYLCVCIWSVQQDLNTYLKYNIIPFELAYVNKYKESTQLSDSRNPILSCIQNGPFDVLSVQVGGITFTSVNFYFLPPSENLTYWLG